MRSSEPMATRLGRVCRALLLTGLAALAGATVAGAQDARGSITGRVIDTSGGVLPGVSVTVVNTDTNRRPHHVPSDQRPLHRPLPAARHLPRHRDARRLPDRRQRATSRSASATRCRSTSRSSRAASPRRSASSPSGPSSRRGTATMGQVIDSKLIGEIPLGDGTAYGLTRLVAGRDRSSAPTRCSGRWTTTTCAASPSAAPSTASSPSTARATSCRGARVGIQPPSDAIQEFKVETAVYDAQIGHTGAGNVNLALKSGTNAFHGAGLVLQPRRLALGQPVRVERAAAPAGHAARLQPLQRHASRPDLQEQDVLHGVVREAAGRHDRDGHRLGADRAHAATATSPSCWPSACRSSTRARRGWSTAWSPAIRSRATSSRTNRINPIALQRPEVLSRCPTRPAHADLAEQLLRRAAVDLRLQLPDGARRSRVDARATAPTSAASATSAARSATTSPASSNGVDDHAGRHRSLQLQLRASATRRSCRRRLVLDVKGSWLRFNDDLYPIGHARPGRARLSRRRRWRCSATTSTFRASRIESAQRHHRRRGRRRSAASRTASTPAARSRSTTCSSRRRSPGRGRRTR